ncbi:hypothetical protein D3C80_504080 [compost metagenome]
MLSEGDDVCRNEDPPERILSCSNGLKSGFTVIVGSFILAVEGTKSRSAVLLGAASKSMAGLILYCPNDRLTAERIIA